MNTLKLNHFTVPERTLVKKGSTKGVLETMTLEEVRDYLRKLEERQLPLDFERSLDQLFVDFASGRMEASWKETGTEAASFRVSTHGAGMLAREVLPSRFFAGLKQLAKKDERGAKLATLVWSKFSEGCSDVRMVRTVKMRVDGDVHRVIRSCHSQGYATYSNLEFVQDILDNAEEYAKLPILSWQVADSGMRLRFAALDAVTVGFSGLDPDFLLQSPIPMIEAWNSEVGRRRVGLRGGMWKLVCTNGMGSWDERSDYNWIHRGDADRIRRGVRDAFINITNTANGVVDSYKEATQIEIDDAYQWLTDELNGNVPDRVVIAAQKGLSDPTTTPGGKLASVIDAVTLVAQEEDLFGQYEVERVAAKMLKRGLNAALKNNGKITA